MGWVFRIAAFFGGGVGGVFLAQRIVGRFPALEGSDIRICSTYGVCALFTLSITLFILTAPLYAWHRKYPAVHSFSYWNFLLKDPFDHSVTKWQGIRNAFLYVSVLALTVALGAVVWSHGEVINVLSSLNLFSREYEEFSPFSLFTLGLILGVANLIFAVVEQLRKG